MGPDEIQYVCSRYTAPPTSPGRATLNGAVSYTPTGGPKAFLSEVNTSVVLK